MPSLPPNPALPFLDPAETWPRRWHELFSRLWTSLIYTVNALCKIDTLANRLSTPAIDESFFYENDSKALSIASSGAWQNVGPRRGSATIAAGNTSATVSLSPNEPNANYRISLSTNYDHGRMWWTSKAASGWTINVITAAPVGGATVDWILMRD